MIHIDRCPLSRHNGNLRHGPGTIRFDSRSSVSSASDSPSRAKNMSSTFHVFALPVEILQKITLRSRLSQQTVVESDKAEQQDLSSQTVPIHGSRACNVCLGATFTDVEEQRTHFRSDWHRYNVKIRLRGGKPISEVDFAKLVDSTCTSTTFCAALLTRTFRPRRLHIWLRLRIGQHKLG
jgi:hypothetical protein